MTWLSLIGLSWYALAPVMVWASARLFWIAIRGLIKNGPLRDRRRAFSHA
jgi:hypothetical protein